MTIYSSIQHSIPLIHARTNAVRVMAGMLVLFSMLLPQQVLAAVSCSVTATGPAFGIYNPLNVSPTLANSSISATCTLVSGGTTTINLVSSYSAGNSGSFVSRSMKSGTNVLSYNLYFDAAYTQIRGDGTGGSQVGGGSLTLTTASRTQSVPTSTIYGRIPAGQDVAPGSYSDTIVVTVTY